MPARTLYQVLTETARQYGDATALRQPWGLEPYRTLSWNQYQRAAEEIAAGLRELGIGNGEIVALNSETRLEFYLADLGIVTNGSAAAALYPNHPPAELVRMIANTGASAVFVEDPKVLRALCQAPVAHWILLTGEADGALCWRSSRHRLMGWEGGSGQATSGNRRSGLMKRVDDLKRRLRSSSSFTLKRPRYLSDSHRSLRG